MPTLLPKPLSPQPTHAAPGLPAPQGVCVSEEDHLQPQQHRCSNTVEVRSAAASHCGSRSPSRTTYARGGVEGRRIYTPLQEETSNSSYSSRRGSTPMMMMMMADASSSSSSPMCRTSPIGAVRSSPPRHHRTGRPPMMQQHRQPMMESKGQPTTTTFSAHNNINKNHTHVGSTRVQAAAALHGRVKSVEKARPTSVFVSSPPKTRITPPATTTTTTTASASPSTEWRTKHEAATTTTTTPNAHSARSTAAVEEVRKVKQNARPPPQPRTRSPTINAASSSMLVRRASPNTTTAPRERCARRDAEASSTRSSSRRLPHGYVEALTHIQRSLLTEARRQRLRNTNNKAEMLRQRQQLFRQYSSIPPHTQERRRQIYNNNNITTTTSPSCSAETVEGVEEAWRRTSSSPRSPRSKTTSTDERGFSHPLRCARDEDVVVEQMGATLGTSPRRARTPPRPWSGDDVPLRARMTVRCVKGVAGQHHWRCVQCEDDLFDALHNTVPQRVVEEMAPRTCTHNNTNTNNIIYPSSIDDVLQWLDEVQAKRGRRLTKTHA